MASKLITLADGIKAALDAATSLSLAFTAERRYVVHRALEELTGVDISIVPAEQSLTFLTRGSDEFNYAVDMGIIKRIGSGEMSEIQVNAACDPLMGFVEEIMDLFRGGLIEAGSIRFRNTGITNAPTYSTEHVDEFRAFLSVMRLTYVLTRGR